MVIEGRERGDEEFWLSNSLSSRYCQWFSVVLLALRQAFFWEMIHVDSLKASTKTDFGISGSISSKNDGTSIFLVRDLRNSGTLQVFGPLRPNGGVPSHPSDPAAAPRDLPFRSFSFRLHIQPRWGRFGWHLLISVEPSRTEPRSDPPTWQTRSRLRSAEVRGVSLMLRLMMIVFSFPLGA